VSEPLIELEAKAAAGEPLTRADADRLTASPDLVAIGWMAESARKALSGDVVTYGRVCAAPGGTRPAEIGDAGEVRLEGTPGSADEALDWVRIAVGVAGKAPLTAFSLADLFGLANHDVLALAEFARRLREEGLDGVAEAPIDRLGEADHAAEVVRAARHGGLAVLRATVSRAPVDVRLDLVERAAAVQQRTGAFRAFAPLPRVDPADAPATGYDDVRTIAAARLMCRDVPFVQVDWPVYGPKLAQVAIAFGANDVDGVASVSPADLGRRRSPREEIERQIRSAHATPAERDGRYERRP
jgi:aminodeoxyfutalosine synthase